MQEFTINISKDWSIYAMDFFISEPAKNNREIREGWYLVRPPDSSETIIIHFDEAGVILRERRTKKRDPIRDYKFLKKLLPTQIA